MYFLLNPNLTQSHTSKVHTNVHGLSDLCPLTCAQRTQRNIQPMQKSNLNPNRPPVFIKQGLICIKCHTCSPLECVSRAIWIPENRCNVDKSTWRFKWVHYNEFNQNNQTKNLIDGCLLWKKWGTLRSSVNSEWIGTVIGCHLCKKSSCIFLTIALVVRN